MKSTMLSRHTWRSLALCAIVVLAGGGWMPAHSQQPGAAATGSAACPGDDSGLALPPGFCATVFADNLGHPRHLVVAANGVVYANTWSGRFYGNDTLPAGGFLVALRDSKGTGRADVVERFGETVQSGGTGGTGIALYGGYLYAEINDRIVRYALKGGKIAPPGPGQVVVSDLPHTGDHQMHPFVITSDGALYMDSASATNACQVENRALKSPGVNPCTELLTRGGIWRYDAKKTDQKFSPAERFATGIRNADGIAVDSTGRGIYATQHGRDQLSMNWPDLYQPEQGATLPAEELLRVTPGADFGWPVCYFDPAQNKLVLAPEYGGDGGHAVGPCASKLAPAAAFPAHWAPNDLLLYYRHEFPAHYRDGAFIAFHGSWNRAPFPQGGYNVVYQPLKDGRASGQCEIFADGFAGANADPQKAAHRPSGLALGPDGALYISDDAHGRIYRIAYRGGAGADTAALKSTPCPSADAPAGAIMVVGAEAGGGAADAASAAANLSAPVGATQAMVILGERVYRAQIGAAACAGCHGADGRGSAVGPTLRGGQWLWSDGSYAGIQKTITDGVANPKNYRAAMPALGGAQLSAEQVASVAAYVWALNHADAR